MRDETALQRQWNILRALVSRRLGTTVRELAAEAGVTEKTIRRDLDLFRRVGFCLQEEVGEFGRKTFRMTGPAGQPPLNFNLDEAVALYLGRRLMEPLAGTPVWEAVKRPSASIQATFGSTADRRTVRNAVLSDRRGQARLRRAHRGNR